MVQRWLPTGLNPIIRAETDLINQLVDYLSSDELSNSSSENAKHYPVPGSFENAERLLLFFGLYDLCWSDKTSSLKMSSRALGNYNM